MSSRALSRPVTAGTGNWGWVFARPVTAGVNGLNVMFFSSKCTDSDVEEAYPLDPTLELIDSDKDQGDSDIEID